MKILIDTNAYTELLKGNENVLDYLESCDTVFLSVAVIAELLTGFKGGSKEKDNVEILQDFISNSKVKVINITLKTSVIFSDIKHYLKLKGTPIPINDIWIAAQCYECKAKLISFDKHFRNIPKIDIWEYLFK